MIQNYLKTAFRNFQKNKVHCFINLTSLCIGITCAIFIYTYVKHELSYDRFFKKADQIYRMEYKAGFSSVRYASINQYVNPGSLSSIPGVENQVRFAPLSNVFVEANGKRMIESDFWAADSTFFILFDFPLPEGNKNSAFAQPNSIVITQKTAQKYFGNQKVIGKTLIATFQNNSITLTVTGVADVPSNTHLQFGAVVSGSILEELYDMKLSDIYTAYNYLLLGKGQDPAEIEKRLSELSKKTRPEAIDYRLKPITDIHLYSSARGEIGHNSDIRYVYFFSAIAVVLLIIAGINFTSLATAQALQRYKEAGIRKTLGARKGQLIGQFLVEAVILSLMATAVGTLVIYYVLPSFNTLTGYHFIFSDFFDPASIPIVGLASVGIGLLAGIYPAILLSAFQPVKTLKGITPSGKKGAAVWKSIVIIQFAASVAMIICTVTIYRQLTYIQTKNLGFERDRIITVINLLGEHYAPLKSRLKMLAGVENVSASSYIPGVSKTSGTALVQKTNSSDSLTFNWISVDYDYFDTYGIDIVEGRAFSRNFGTDSTQAFMINREAVRILGWEFPIGKQVKAFNKKGTIVGITENFNFLSLHQTIPPIIFAMDNSLIFNVSIKLTPESNIPATVAQIKNSWNELLPNTPFDYSFVNEQFDALYKADQRMGTVFILFASLAILIACLGLFSLSSFIATKKRKEVSIRKILGATISSILLSFYKNYGKLVITACLIAVPVPYFFLKNWLQQFAFKTAISFWVFLIAVVAVLCIALVTVSYESIKTAISNPVDTLKNE